MDTALTYKNIIICLQKSSYLNLKIKCLDTSFIIDGIKFKILQRKNITKNKSSLYLACFINNKFYKYISSLYLQKDTETATIYLFDYEGTYYFLIFNKQDNTIKIIQGKQKQSRLCKN